MNQENWQKIKEIFHQARELAPDERTEFLDKACAGNAEMREQVEIFLESYESDFLEETAVHKVVEAVGGSSLQTGQTIGHYLIKELLGTGGMGEVFLADDTKLHRPVAFKVLHSEIAEDEERVRRFTLEARAASALNHPNILTIHEIGDFEGSQFIVSEYVKGETLREMLKRGNLDLPKSLDIAAQVAAALEAAHTNGIVHRDIKPENIIIRNDKLVKVLDFGLAKLVRSKEWGSKEKENSTLEMSFSPPTPHSLLPTSVTSPGVVMGTVAYMSPEQARGVTIDARTDIWSLGVVLYEMLSGKLPFPGETTSDIIASILKTEAEPLEKFNKDIPPELEKICFKALAKDVNERYQTAQEFLQDLRQAKKHLETRSEQTTVKHFNYSDEKNTEIIRHRSTLSREYIVGKVKQHKVGFSVLLGILLLTLGIGTGSYWLLSQRNQANNIKERTDDPPQTMKISRVTTTGMERNGTISPDGKYLVYVSERDGMQSLILRQIATGNTKELLPPAKVKFPVQSQFSPDGNYIYYITLDGNADYGNIYRVSILGGDSVRLVSSVDRGLSLSPDGKRIAYTYQNYTTKEMGVRVSLVEDLLAKRGEAKTIFVQREPKYLDKISWSPDGNSIACITLFQESEKGLLFQIVAIDPDGLNERVITTGNWAEILSLVWLKDSKELLFTGKRATEEPVQIWYLKTKGEIIRVTNDLNKYVGLSLPADNSFLITSQYISQANVLIGEVSNKTPNLFFEENGFKQIPQEIDSGVHSMAFTPDGKIIYKSAHEGKQLFIMNPDGSDNRQLTFDSKLNPMFSTVSPDGRFVAFIGADKEYGQIYLLELQSGSLKQLTTITSGILSFLKFGADGQTIFYGKFTGELDASYLNKISIEGGSPNEIHKIENAGFLGLSPDEKLVAFIPRSDEDTVFGIKPLMNDQATPKYFTLQRYPFGVGYFVDWTSDSRAFIYLSETNGVVNLKGVPVAGNKPFEITNFRSGRINNFVFSPDRKRLAVTRETINTDVVMIKNFD